MVVRKVLGRAEERWYSKTNHDRRRHTKNRSTLRLERVFGSFGTNEHWLDLVNAKLTGLFGESSERTTRHGRTKLSFQAFNSSTKYNRRSNNHFQNGSIPRALGLVITHRAEGYVSLYALLPLPSAYAPVTATPSSTSVYHPITITTWYLLIVTSCGRAVALEVGNRS